MCGQPGSWRAVSILIFPCCYMSTQCNRLISSVLEKLIQEISSWRLMISIETKYIKEYILYLASGLAQLKKIKHLQLSGFYCSLTVRKGIMGFKSFEQYMAPFQLEKIHIRIIIGNLCFIRFISSSISGRLKSSYRS